MTHKIQILTKQKHLKTKSFNTLQEKEEFIEEHKVDNCFLIGNVWYKIVVRLGDNFVVTLDDYRQTI